MHTHRVKGLFVLVMALVAVLGLAACAPAGTGIDVTEQATLPPVDEGVDGATPEATAVATGMVTPEVTDEGDDDGTGADDDVGDVSGETLAETLAADQQLSMFARLLIAAVNSNMLAGVDLENASFTLFVPSQDVWATVPTDQATALTSDAVAAQNFFGCYVAEGMLSQGDMTATGSVATLTGETITVEGEPGDVRLNGDVQIMQEITTSNGVIYVVDDLLCPLGE